MNDSIWSLISRELSHSTTITPGLCSQIITPSFISQRRLLKTLSTLLNSFFLFYWSCQIEG